MDGLLYLTVEEIAESEIDEAFDLLTKRGIPAVRGEIVEGDVAGCHYFPGRDRVLDRFHGQAIGIATYPVVAGWCTPGVRRTARVRCRRIRPGRKRLVLAVTAT
jgi:hypothetical protein